MDIDINDYDIFKNNKNTLKELSADENKKDEVFYMVGLEDLAVDFDEVKRVYANSFSTTEEVLNSVDAILQHKEKIYFIEFKNGEIIKK